MFNDMEAMVHRLGIAVWFGDSDYLLVLRNDGQANSLIHFGDKEDVSIAWEIKA